jgi:hypothetical protein
MDLLGLDLFLFQKAEKLSILMEKHFKELVVIELLEIFTILNLEMNIGFLELRKTCLTVISLVVEKF